MYTREAKFWLLRFLVLSFSYLPACSIWISRLLHHRCSKVWCLFIIIIMACGVHLKYTATIFLKTLLWLICYTRNHWHLPIASGQVWLWPSLSPFQVELVPCPYGHSPKYCMVDATISQSVYHAVNLQILVATYVAASNNNSPCMLGLPKVAHVPASHSLVVTSSLKLLLELKGTV